MCRKLSILAHDLPPYSSGVGSYMRVITLGTFFKQAGFKVILFGASKKQKFNSVFEIEPLPLWG